MNKKIVAFFICSFIAVLVNSSPIDSAGEDGKNVPPGSSAQDEELPSSVSTKSSIPSTFIPKLLTVEVSNTSKSNVAPLVNAVTNAISLENDSISDTTTPPTTPPTTKATTTTVTPTESPTTKPSDTTLTPIMPTLPSNTTTSPTIPSQPTTPTVPTTTPNETTTASTTTTVVPLPTTPVPAPTAAPSKDRRFDGPSFIGGIVLSLGIMAIAFVAWKFYKARTERNYHTL